MAIEEEFRIVITEQEAINIYTPNDLTNLVFSKLRQNENSGCLSQSVFYTVRKNLIEIAGASRGQIKPNTHLSELISKKEQKKILKKVTTQLSGNQEVYLDFAKPEWLNYLTNLCGLSIFVICLLQSDYHLTLSIVITIIFLLIFNTATISLKNELPREFQTVKDLVKITTSLDSTIWCREDVYTKVKEIIVEQLGVGPNQVLPDSHFIDDLGMD
nr:hypothetical protein [Desulfogranum japonicum]